MKAGVALFPEDLKKIYTGRETVVVADILRATTTIITALHNGAGKVAPFEEPAAVFTASKEYKENEVILCGERNSVRIPGFDLGNSPLEYTEQAVKGKTVLFTTTNGTRVLSMLRNSVDTLIGGFINVSLVVNRILYLDKDFIIACAGNNGRFSLEDSLFAGMVLSRVFKNKQSVAYAGDSAAAAYMLYEQNKNSIESSVKSSVHAGNLINAGFERDVEFALKVDSVNVLPVLQNNAIIL
ncbi:2-phosphosulfolactate phosphatase [candidate division KSB1 bacterium]|nr:MAG: 2-phosphosulfolactate phosphatase [candidate division KSB1 bacterium]